MSDLTANALMIDALSDTAIVGVTLYGEARSERIEGRIAVANVLKNRLKAGRWGRTYRSVALAPKQFSCWNLGTDLNSQRVLNAVRLLTQSPDPPVPTWAMLRECLWIADGLMWARFASNVGAATNYYAPAAMVPPGRVPDWAVGLEPVAVIGSHRFYEGVR